MTMRNRLFYGFLVLVALAAALSLWLRYNQRNQYADSQPRVGPYLWQYSAVGTDARGHLVGRHLPVLERFGKALLQAAGGPAQIDEKSRAIGDLGQIVAGREAPEVADVVVVEQVIAPVRVPRGLVGQKHCGQKLARRLLR